MKKSILFYIILSLLSLSSCKKKEEETSKTNEPFIISDMMMKTTTFATVKNEQLKNELRFFGKISADKNKLVEVFPVVGGSVEKVNVELGDFVHKGQVLAVIRSTEVAGYEKDYEDAKNEVIVAQNNLKVTQELYEGKLSTEREVIQSKSELEKAKSQLNRLKQNYKIYNLKPGSIYEVVAPLTGYIIQKNITQDMKLRSDKTDNIFDVADIKDVWAIANVNEIDINEVKLGMNASIATLSNPDKIFYGKVDKIFKIIDPETNAMNVRIVLDNRASLLVPESKATIKISYTEDKKVPCIPSSGVIFENNKHLIF